MSDKVEELTDLIARSYELERRVQQLQRTIDAMRSDMQRRVAAHQRVLDGLHARSRDRASTTTQ